MFPFLETNADTTPPELKPDENGNGPSPIDPATGKPTEQPEPQSPSKPEPTKPDEKEKQLDEASKGKGDDNPNKQIPKPCDTPDCRTALMGEYKKKSDAMFGALSVQTGSKSEIISYKF